MEGVASEALKESYVEGGGLGNRPLNSLATNDGPVADALLAGDTTNLVPHDTGDATADEAMSLRLDHGPIPHNALLRHAARYWPILEEEPSRQILR